MRRRVAMCGLFIAAVAILDGATRLPPSKYALAYVIMTDVRGGPPGDEEPESTAVRLAREAVVLLNADSVVVVPALTEDTMTVCATVSAKACDFVFVREKIAPIDSSIVVLLEVRNKALVRHHQQVDEPGCDKTDHWRDWRYCRDRHLSDFAIALRDHASKGHAK